MTDETRVCRICGADIERWEPSRVGAHPPDLCKACAFDRIDFAKAIVTGFCANNHVTSMKEQHPILVGYDQNEQLMYSDETFMVSVFDMAEEMLLESRKPRGES